MKTYKIRVKSDGLVYVFENTKSVICLKEVLRKFCHQFGPWLDIVDRNGEALVPLTRPEINTIANRTIGEAEFGIKLVADGNTIELIHNETSLFFKDDQNSEMTDEICRIINSSKQTSIWP